MRSSVANWRIRFLVALVICAVVLSGGLATGYWYLSSKWNNAQAVDLQLDAGPVTNYLLLGSDSRAFVESGQDVQSFGHVAGQRADTIIVVHVDRAANRALLASFPRDLYVKLPSGRRGRINSAFSDGPQGVIDTLKQDFDIPIQRFIQVGFPGVRNIVDALGGVQVCVDAPARDLKTGLNIEQAGCHTLKGDQALAWVRSRHYQYMKDGRWVSQGTGDYGRIERQQDFIRRMMSQALQAASINPLKGNRVVDRALANLVVDSHFGLADALELVRVFRSSDPQALQTVTIPSHPTRIGGASVVVLEDQKAAPIFETLRSSGGVGAVQPSDVTVRVLNGVGVKGLATKTLAELEKVGFTSGGAGDTQTSGPTEIHFSPAERDQAILVQQHLAGVGTLVEDQSLSGADVVVVIGTDFKGVTG